MNLQHPVARARGLGSAKDGYGHWMVQRLTAIALALLTPWFLWLLLGLVGVEHAQALARVGTPLNASLLLAWIIALLWHAQLGVQVVIEDYVHSPALALGSQILIRLLFAFAAIAAVFAVLRISIGA